MQLSYLKVYRIVIGIPQVDFKKNLGVTNCIFCKEYHGLL